MENSDSESVPVIRRNRKVIDLDKNRLAKCSETQKGTNLWSRPLSFSGFFSKKPPKGNNGNNSSNKVQNMDLHMIKKLEDEIYKRREARKQEKQIEHEEAKDFNQIYFQKQQYGHDRKTFYRDNSAFNSNNKPVLLLDSNALEPLLMKRPLSTDDSSSSASNSHKSIIIFDNSQFYPVLMRYDIRYVHFLVRASIEV